MSEEEIINQVKDIMADREYFAKNYEEDDNIFKRDIKALQGILDLYQKEKDKNNKELQIIQKTNNIIKANINRNILNELYDRTKEENIDFFSNKIIEANYLETLSKIYYNLNFNNIEGDK